VATPTTVGDSGGGDILPETKSLVSKVITLIDEGQGHFPKWLSSLKTEKGDMFKKVVAMISLGEELKTKLGKFRTPNAMQELNEIHLRYVSLFGDKASTSSSTSSSSSVSTSTSLIPLFDHADSTDPIEKVLAFLSTIEETTGGV
jgi:hypothetical protein